MADVFLNEFKRRFAKEFLDILVLRFIKREPMWGYRIIKIVENLYGTKVRHGALYSLLNSLEQDSFLTSKLEVHGKRARRVYTITPKGTLLIDSYYNLLKEQTQMLNHEEIRNL